MAKDNARCCSLCGQAVTERYLPFCSATCADRDLGHWLAGSYVIPVRSESDIEAGELIPLKTIKNYND